MDGFEEREARESEADRVEYELELFRQDPEAYVPSDPISPPSDASDDEGEVVPLHEWIPADLHGQVKKLSELGTWNLLSGRDALRWAVWQQMLRTHPYTRMSNSDLVACLNDGVHDKRVEEVAREYGFHSSDDLLEFMSDVDLRLTTSIVKMGTDGRPPSPVDDLFAIYCHFASVMREIAEVSGKMKLPFCDLAKASEGFQRGSFRTDLVTVDGSEEVASLSYEAASLLQWADTNRWLSKDILPDRLAWEWELDFTHRPYPMISKIYLKKALDARRKI